MTSKSKQLGVVLVFVVGALTTLGTALWVKGSEYQNAWLYVFAVWLIIGVGFNSYTNWRICKSGKK